MSAPDEVYPSFEIAEPMILDLIAYLEDDARHADIENPYGALSRRRVANEWRKFLEHQRLKHTPEQRCAS